MKFADARVSGQPPNNRVFPPAATDHKYAHATGAYRLAGVYRGPAYNNGRSCRVWSRRGPTPTALTGAPDSSSIART